jgi:hypothetical protein
MVAMARAGAGNHYYGDTADDLMEPFQQELELLGNLCLRDLRLAATVPDGFSVEIVSQLPKTDTGRRLGDWTLVDSLLEVASRQFAGKEWVAAVLEAIRSIAAGRECARAMKEMMYSSSKLRSRLAAKNESTAFSVAENASVPAYLRRKPAQGKGDV